MNKAEFWQTLVFRFFQKAAGKKTWHKVSTSPPLTTKNILVRIIILSSECMQRETENRSLNVVFILSSCTLQPLQLFGAILLDIVQCQIMKS